MVNARQAKSAREKSAELRAEAARKEARRRAGATVGAVMAALVVVVGAGILIKAAQHDQQVKQQAASAPPANLTDGGFLVGKPDAKVTITVYEDFLCPACGGFEAINGDQIAKWVAAGTVNVSYHPVAILDHQSSTKYSTRALNAVAAVINTKPSAFVKFHTLLFENQPKEGGSGLPDTQLIDYAVQAGVDRTAVESAVTGLKYEGWTAKVTEDFSVKGYNATPTILVNGKKLESYAPDDLKAAVEAAAKG